MIGKTKELMDLVDPDLVAVEVTSTFGPYIKYYLDANDESRETTRASFSCASGPRNAFHILLQAQATLSSRQLPNLNQNPRNGKEKLRNHILSFLSEKNCKWNSNSEVEKVAEGFLHSLSNIFLYIDGHHDCLKRQAFPVPCIFAQFSGYNRPELSKHRKREFTNLEKSTLRSLSSHLFFCLQDQYWERENWRALKDDMVTLAQSISGYAEYLDCSNKRSKVLQCQCMKLLITCLLLFFR